MKKQLMLACLAFCLAFSSHSMAAEKNGWRSEAGGSVYYVKGTKAKRAENDRLLYLLF